MILVKTIIIMRQADGKSENYDREYKEIPATTYNIGYMTLTGFYDLWVLLAMTVRANMLF
jgi:hypothetical protein